MLSADPIIVTLLEASGSHLEASGGIWEASGGIWRHPGGIWGHPGGIWRHPGAIWRHLGASWRHPGGIWRHLGGMGAPWETSRAESTCPDKGKNLIPSATYKLQQNQLAERFKDSNLQAVRFERIVGCQLRNRGYRLKDASFEALCFPA